MLPTIRTVRHMRPVMIRPEVRLNMDRWFDEVIGRTVTTRPDADMYETENEFVVELDLAAAENGHVDVTFEQGVLSISGERRLENEETQAKYHVRERSWARFVRRFVIPSMIDASKVEASSDRGVLKVVMPKSVEAKARKVEIEVA